RLSSRASAEVRLPRLVFSPLVIAGLIVTGIIGIALNLSWLDSSGVVQSWVDANLGFMSSADLPAEVVHMILLLTAAVLVLISLSGNLLTPFSGIIPTIQNLLSHEYRASAGIAGGLTLRRGARADAMARRHEIEDRLTALLKHLIAGRYD